jgi:N-methylhydantoinase A
VALSLAVDIGGTFTDLIGFDDSSGQIFQAKALSTPRDLADGVMACVQESGLALAEAHGFIHGSTVAINTAIEQTGARTALVVTRGTRDVYTIARGNRPEAYNIFFNPPRPLVPRRLTFEVDQRISADGEVLVPFEVEQATRVAREVVASGVEAVAVCFLHSYLDPTDETRMGEILRQAAPDAYVTLSHEIVREYREYERTSTSVLNAYVGPRCSAYIASIQQRLSEAGFGGRFLIMQSNGGVMSAEVARRVPVAMMESGPVGGVMAAARIGPKLGFPDVIAFDMGGTTAKTSLIENGEASIAQGYYIGGYAEGHPVTLPVVDIVEVGAGGGSIAWIDEVGAVKVGPQSAGAEPGPICYRRGGTQPTVTDANVVLGRIGADSFLGGTMPLDGQAAVEGIERRLSGHLGLDPIAAALGILRIAVAKMSLTVQGVSVERGYDPRSFALMAFGGAGPVHAVEIARELNIPRVIIPVLPAHFSALGLLTSDLRHDYVRTYYKPLLEADFAEVSRICDELIGEATRVLQAEGVASDAMTFQRWLDLRYVGQEFWLQVPLSQDELGGRDLESIRRRFDDMHDRRYGQASEGEPLELVNVRLTAWGRSHNVPLPTVHAERAQALIGTRPIYLQDARQPVDCAVYARPLLGAGQTVTGPAVMEEHASTTLLFEGDVATIADSGEIIIQVGDA